MAKIKDYPFEVRPLSDEDGGGYRISFPDFAECISDGESVEEAIENGRDALKATIAALKARKLPVPAPSSAAPGNHTDFSAMATYAREAPDTAHVHAFGRTPVHSNPHRRCVSERMGLQPKDSQSLRLLRERNTLRQGTKPEG